MYDMLKKSIIILLIVLASLVLTSCSACSGTTSTETTKPVPTDTLVPTATYTPEPTATIASQEEGEAGSEEQVVVTPTPGPTATPGPIDEVVSAIVEATGVSDTYLLRLSVEDWINLAISVLIILIGIFLGSRLVVWLLRRIVKRTTTEYDEGILDEIRG